MKLVSIFSLAVSLFLISCSLVSSDEKSAISIVDVNTRVEFFSPQKQIEAIESTVRIVSWANQRVYIVPRMKVEEQNVLNEDGKIIGTKGAYTDTSYVAFAWNVGDTLGLKYRNLDNFRNENATAVHIDSVFSEIGLSADNFAAFNIELPPPITVLKKGNKKHEKYSIEKVHSNGIDSVYRTYDKSLKNVDFSFSEKLDKQSNSKLCKITFIWNKSPKGVLLPDTDVPRRVGYYEMVVGSDKNLNRLKELFKKAKNDRKAQFGRE